MYINLGLYGLKYHLAYYHLPSSEALGTHTAVECFGLENV